MCSCMARLLVGWSSIQSALLRSLSRIFAVYPRKIDIPEVLCQVNDFLAGIGLGAVGDQLKDLRLSELLDTLPPGVDEAVAISKVSPH